MIITSLPASTTYTPKQALLSVLEFVEHDNLQDVLIAGYDADGCLLVRSSRMDRKDALWLAEKMRDWALNGGLE